MLIMNVHFDVIFTKYLYIDEKTLNVFDFIFQAFETKRIIELFKLKTLIFWIIFAY